LSERGRTGKKKKTPGFKKKPPGKKNGLKKVKTVNPFSGGSPGKPGTGNGKKFKNLKKPP